MKRRNISLHYCGWCKITTRHNQTELTATCVRCGMEKHVTRNSVPSIAGKPRFES